MRAPAHWQSRSLVSWLCWPLSHIYHGVVLLRTWRITPQRLGVPVICVGNNTVGGTGKTPTVIAVCRQLQAMGYTPHVISRGYKGRYEGTARVDPGVHIAEEVGDEPLLIARVAPCWVARRRLHAARAAIAEGADVVVMDDGLQNPSLHKDLSILVVNGSYGFGNRLMLPAGPCREPVRRSMRKADAVLVMGERRDPALVGHIPPDMPVFEGRLVPQNADDWRDVRVHPFAGIGHPQKFFETVKQLGALITRTSAFADHHVYTARDIERLLREARAHEAKLVTTEKDWVRLPEPFRAKVCAIAVTLHIEPADSFASFLQTRL